MREEGQSMPLPLVSTQVQISRMLLHEGWVVGWVVREGGRAGMKTPPPPLHTHQPPPPPARAHLLEQETLGETPHSVVSAFVTWEAESWGAELGSMPEARSASCGEGWGGGGGAWGWEAGRGTRAGDPWVPRRSLPQATHARTLPLTLSSYLLFSRMEALK